MEGIDHRGQARGLGRSIPLRHVDRDGPHVVRIGGFSSAITGTATPRPGRRSCSGSYRSRASLPGVTSVDAEPLDDLVQVASLGLLKAIDRFEPERPTAFSSFAVPTILGELKRHFRDKGWSVRVPRDLQEMAVRVDREAEDLARALGRAPTTD